MADKKIKTGSKVKAKLNDKSTVEGIVLKINVKGKAVIETDRGKLIVPLHAMVISLKTGQAKPKRAKTKDPGQLLNSRAKKKMTKTKSK